MRFNEDGEPAGVKRLGIAMEPEADYERRPGSGGGCEDPRITFVEPLQRYVRTYTALSPRGPRIALALSEDLFRWQRLGLATLASYDGIEFDGVDNKDASFFPIAVPNPSGQPELAILHRPLFPGTRPEETACCCASRELDLDRESTWISYCPLAVEGRETHRFGQFNSHHRLATPVSSWERLKIGGGTPPILTPHGWLILYHGVAETAGPSNGGHHLSYSAGVMVICLFSRSRPVAIAFSQVRCPTILLFLSVSGLKPASFLTVSRPRASSCISGSVLISSFRSWVAGGEWLISGEFARNQARPVPMRIVSILAYILQVFMKDEVPTALGAPQIRHGACRSQCVGWQVDDSRASSNNCKEDLAMGKFWMSVVLAVSMATLTLNSVATAAEQQTVKVGKKGEIMLDHDTKIGEITLKRGHYQIQHRVDGSDHMIHFTQLKGVHRDSGYESAPLGADEAGEVKCQLEPLNAKASETAITMSIEGGVRRIIRITIRGENVAHVF